MDKGELADLITLFCTFQGEELEDSYRQSSNVDLKKDYEAFKQDLKELTLYVR